MLLTAGFLFCIQLHVNGGRLEVEKLKPITSRKITYEFFPFDQKDLLGQIEKKMMKTLSNF